MFSSNIFNKLYSKWYFVMTLAFIAFVIRKHTRKKKAKNSTSGESTDSIAGFAYDDTQDIFYSTQDAWQRPFGYCRAYDVGAAPSSMIIDCEPLRFEYEGRNWLIELWKGQYGITTGGEVGVYTSKESDSQLPKLLDNIFYGETLDENHLYMEFALLKDNKLLFTRSDRGWWLTGFALGMFSNPRELSMQVKIQLKTKEMCDIFVETLKKAGYRDKELLVTDDTVIFIFDKPRTPQPITQSGFLARLIQEKNRLLCHLILYITKDFNNSFDKFIYLEKKVPMLTNKMAVNGNKKMQRAVRKTQKQK